MIDFNNIHFKKHNVPVIDIDFDSNRILGPKILIYKDIYYLFYSKSVTAKKKIFEIQIYIS